MYVSIYLCIHPSIYLCICLSIYLSIYLYIYIYIVGDRAVGGGRAVGCVPCARAGHSH